MRSRETATYTVRLEPRDARAFIVRYVVKVTEVKEDAEYTWSVLRRYTDFKTLYTELRHADIALPSLPDKSFFRKAFNAEFRAQRLQQLDELLQEIISIDPELKLSAVNAFFCQRQQLRKLDEDASSKEYAANAEANTEKSNRLSVSTEHLQSEARLGIQDAYRAPQATLTPPSPVHLCDSSQPLPTEQRVLHKPECSGGAVGSDWKVSSRRAAASQHAELGDLVSLVGSVLPELAGCKAIVTKVFESHCAVAVLDNSCSCGIGEYWPNHDNISIQSRAWRLGMEVTLVGLRGSKTRHLNGLAGVIVEHPRSGHPSFICKDASPDRSVLTFCVRLDKPDAAGQRSVLVEPKFMQPIDDKFKDAVEHLCRIADEH